MARVQATIESQREGAEVFHGADVCKQKMSNFLADVNLPRGLLPLHAAEEVGYNRETGFVWVRQRKGCEHLFKQIKKLVYYGTEVTAFVEDRRMRRISGVKSKELLIWASISDMFIDGNDAGKITFKNPTGLSRTFPVSAFEEDASEAAAVSTFETEEDASSAAAEEEKEKKSEAEGK